MSETRRLKPITREGVAAALQKAHQYRVLNDPVAAESICLDVLALEPANVDALVIHVLSITDQFMAGAAGERARAEEAAALLGDPYRNAYYRGIICERWAEALLHRAAPRAYEMAHDWLSQAMALYEQAEAIRPAGNDDAILRWNTCVRMLERDSRIQPAIEEAWEPSLE